MGRRDPLGGWHVYSGVVFDYWMGWWEAQEFVDRFCSEDAVEDGLWCCSPSHFLELCIRAGAAFRSVGWEGDFREGPRVCVIPNPETGTTPFLVIAVKQDNGGGTFLFSECDLSSLGFS